MSEEGRLSPETIASLRAELLERHPDLKGERVRLFSASGRINLLGEHTDYSDGFCLPAATNRRVAGAFASAPDGRPRIVVHSRRFASDADFCLEEIPELPPGDWQRYVASTAKVLKAEAARRGVPLAGMRAVIDSDIPVGSGLSSSAALELLILNAWCRLSGVELSPRELALLGQKAEWEYGVQCGILDQLAIVNGRKGEVSLVDCRTLDATPIKIALNGFRFLIGFTKERSLVASEYNARREECRRAAEVLRDASGRKHIRALRDADPDLVARYAAKLEAVGAREGMKLLPRAEHVVNENARVHRAVDALQRGDVAAFGALMLETHRSLAEKFEVSSPELDAMVDAVLAFSARSGTPSWARMMGGGFGGPVLILAPADAAETLMERVGELYRRATMSEGRFWTVEIEDGLQELG